jgi:hypothetical protein
VICGRGLQEARCKRSGLRDVRQGVRRLLLLLTERERPWWANTFELDAIRTGCGVIALQGFYSLQCEIPM